MPAPVQTCPKCGALIVPQLVRCRQCKAYLHGTSLEGWLFEHLLPAGAAANPGTALIGLGILLYFALMVALTAPISPTSVLAFSGFSLQQLGATHGVSLLLGEHWRFVTSIFAHHDLVHLAFNFWSLTAAGPVVEHIFDKKKMVLTYLAAGVISMIVSFVWYVYVQRQVGFVSAGASGAVCGMIGAAWFGARRMGPEGAPIASGMKRWAIYMVIWGLAMPAINNAAHFGGFVVGAAIAHFMPLGLTKSVGANRVLSVALLGSLLFVAASVGLMLKALHGYPAALERDAEPRWILSIPVYEGTSWQQSDQLAIDQACLKWIAEPTVADEAIRDCSLDIRANSHSAIPFQRLAVLRTRRGEVVEAARLMSVAQRLPE